MKRKRTRNAIAVAIDSSGLSQKEVAKAVGVHQVSVSNWVRGTIPHPDTRAKLAEVLGLSEHEMTGLLPPPPPDNGLVSAVDAVHQHSGPISVTIKGHGLLVQMMVSIETARELLQTLMS